MMSSIDQLMRYACAAEDVGYGLVCLIYDLVKFSRIVLVASPQYTHADNS